MNAPDQSLLTSLQLDSPRASSVHEQRRAIFGQRTADSHGRVAASSDGSTVAERQDGSQLRPEAARTVRQSIAARGHPGLRAAADAADILLK